MNATYSGDVAMMSFEIKLKTLILYNGRVFATEREYKVGVAIPESAHLSDQQCHVTKEAIASYLNSFK